MENEFITKSVKSFQSLVVQFALTLEGKCIHSISKRKEDATEAKKVKVL